MILRPPDDYGPKGPFIIDSTKDPSGNSGLAPGHAWASWYCRGDDPKQEYITVWWRPDTNAQTGHMITYNRCHKKNGIIRRTVQPTVDGLPIHDVQKVGYK